MGDESVGSARPQKISLTLRAPVTAADLPGGAPDFRRILLYDFDDAMDDVSWTVLAEYMGRHRQLSLNVVSEHLRDVDFLERFGWLKRLSIEAIHLQSVDGLVHLAHLEDLDLEKTKRRVSLQVLTELPSLRALGLADHSRELDVLAELPALRAITLTGAKRDNLNFLGAAPQLGILYLSQGRIGDISALPTFPRLQMLTLYRTKVSSLVPIADCTPLVYLDLQGLPVADMPDLSGLAHLKMLQVDLKVLDDLRPLAQAPALGYVSVGSDTLQPEAFTAFAGHPSLEYIDANLGADSRSYRVNQMLDLPRDIRAVYRNDFRLKLMDRLVAG